MMLQFVSPVKIDISNNKNCDKAEFWSLAKITLCRSFCSFITIFMYNLTGLFYYILSSLEID